MIAAAKVHLSHHHIVAASIVEQQEEILLQIRTLINDPDLKQLESHKTAIAARIRMSLPGDRLETSCSIVGELLQHGTKQPRRYSSISILPPEVVDVWPRVVKHLLQRTTHLRRKLEKVRRILTREACVEMVYEGVQKLPYLPKPTSEWAPIVAAGIRDRQELQMLLEMMFSDFYGCHFRPDPLWCRILTDAAAIRGWQLPAIRTWGDFDLSDGEEDCGDDDSPLELEHRLEAAGFSTEIVRLPWQNPTINPNSVMVVTNLGHIEPLSWPLEIIRPHCDTFVPKVA